MKTPTKSGLLSIALFLAALLIFVLSFIRESSNQIQARLGSHPFPPPTTLIINVPSHNNYVLPHPGLLPTNPIYSFKMLRDKVGLMVTINPNKKAQLLLHYADKRIAAARSLSQKGIADIAISTATKAEIYLGQAIGMSPKTDASFQPAYFDSLKQATLKHEEIIEELIARTEGNTRNQAITLHQQLDHYRVQIVSLSKQPFEYARPEDLESVSASSSATPSAAPVSSQDEPYL